MRRKMGSKIYSRAAIIAATIYAALLQTSAQDGVLPGASSFEESSCQEGVSPLAADSQYWRATGAANTRCAIVAYKDGEDIASTKERTPYFAGAQNRKYLAIDLAEADGLYRKTSIANPAINDGIYFDSFVKFTSSRYLRSPVKRQKISISSLAEKNSTNLVITAGFISPANEEIRPRTYKIDSAEIKDGEWYRVTIEAQDNFCKGYVGFRIYLDGKKLTSTEAKSDSPQIPVPDDIFPSLVRTGSYKQTLGAVRFRGKGAVDDLVFTRTNPFPNREVSFNDGAFTIPGDKVEELKILFDTENLDKTIEGRLASYAEAYALGLVDENSGEIEEIAAPEISIAEDGTIKIGEISFPRSAYKITERIQGKTNLDGEWQDITEPGNVNDVPSRFYRVVITIENQ